MRAPLDEAMNSVWHNVDLPIHEAGHIIFGFLGEFIQYLGGSLMQLLMPLVVLFAFLIKNRDAFGASLALWWFGQNFLDLSPYINDARDQVIILLGGVTGQEAPGYHDWNYLLGRLGWLRYDHLLARLSHNAGGIIILTALIWGGYILYRQFENMNTDAAKTE